MGENENLYSGLHYQFTTTHIEQLLALRVDPNVYQFGQVLSLLQTGDQTLDYREAAALLAAQPMWIFPGGSHEFDGFERVIPALIGHFGM
jgi:predicted esterase YcpF (UPF0227 family)